MTAAPLLLLPLQPATTSSTTTTVSTTTTTIPKPIRPIKEGINLNELKQSLTIEEVRAGD